MRRPGRARRLVASAVACFLTLAFAGVPLDRRDRAVAAAPTSLPYDAILQRFAAAGTFDGLALVARGDRIEYAGSAGYADLAHRRRFKVDATFRIASVTKQFTALLVMQEVAAGRLALDAPIARYYHGLPAAAGRITLAQLLSNTSGLPNLDAVPGYYVRGGHPAAHLRRLLATLPLQPVRPAPGTKFAYNNLDFLVAAAVLEAETHRPYARLLRERILQPLHLRGTGLYDGSRDQRRDVAGFELDRGRLVPEHVERFENYGSAGAMYSTLADLFTWDRALQHHTLLSRAATERMFRSDRRFGYVALGSWAYDLPIGPGHARVHLIERQGNIGGVQILNLQAPQQRLAIVLVATTDRDDLFNTYTRRGVPYAVLLTSLRSRARL